MTAGISCYRYPQKEITLLQGYRSMNHLFTFLIGCGTAVNGPAWQASVGDMVPRPMLPEAVALNSMGFNIARSVGPAIGGAIVAAFGASIAFLTNAITYTGLIFVLSRWKPDLPPRTLPRERIGYAMLAGIRYVRLSPSIRNVLVRSIVFCVPAAAVPAMMPLVARDLIAGGPLTYGLLLGGFGIGAVSGALVSRRLRARLTTEQIVRVASDDAAKPAYGIHIVQMDAKDVIAWETTVAALEAQQAVVD